MRHLATSFLLCLVCAFTSYGQNAVNPKPCTRQPEYRQFDFWLGEWDVTVNGKQAGTNSVQLILDKCVIFENWSGAKGMNGKSFNIFNAAKKQWQQFWADDRGTVLEIAGEFKDGAMRLQGETQSPQGKTLHRVTFTPLPNDQVHQFWETSGDIGKTWIVTFDGLYTRKK